MKILKLYPALLLLVLFSCNNDDNDNPDPLLVGLPGAWRLTQSSGGIAGIVTDYPYDQVTWTFDGDGQLAVVNNYNNPENAGVLTTGNYDYQVIASEAPELCAENLLINASNFGCVMLSAQDSRLTLSAVYPDGMQWDFERVYPNQTNKK